MKPNFVELYQRFSTSLSEIDCGEKCGPYNDYGVPVCCDIQLVVPSAYQLEWEYLRSVTDLWRLWRGSSPAEDQALQNEKQDGQVLLACRGYQHCERQNRTLTCRAFPFYPYLTSQGLFSGLAYYQEYREQCWIISNLSIVSQQYKEDFQDTFESLFVLYPETRNNFAEFSRLVREQAAAAGESVILLDFYGKAFLIDPLSEDNREEVFNQLEAFGPFKVTKDLVFPDEKLSPYTEKKDAK